MLAREIKPAFDGQMPVLVTVYQCTRQMPHYHPDTVEMILCLRGSAIVYSMHEKHILSAGDMMEADMYDIHSVSSEDSSLMASFHFDLKHPLFRDQGYDMLYYICSSDDTDPQKIHQMNRVRLLLLALLTCRTDTSCDLQIMDFSKKILKILRKHFQYYNHIHIDEKMYSPEMMERFERIMAYMLKHYSEKCTMRDICREEHISYQYLSRFFKDSSLKTFRNFLHEIRVYHSEHLLLCHPELSVPEVGYLVGFSDPKFFYREFKRKHSQTPYQHRIWYRNYNRKVSPDTVLSIEENSDLIKDCITGLYTKTVYAAEKDLDP